MSLTGHLAARLSLLALIVAPAVVAGCSSDEVRYAEVHQTYTRQAQEDMDRAVARAADDRRSVVGDLPGVPPDHAPWWQDEVARRLYDSADTETCTLDDLYVRTLRHSSQIQAFADLPLIRETGIQEAEGRFDVRAFLEGKYEQVNEPVGSLLTSEVEDLFREHSTSGESGVRWRAPTGADVSLSERLKGTSSNSEFLVPDPQTQARLTLSIAQPLLKGGGFAYNRSTIYIAGIDSEVARSEFLRQAESHLLSVSTAYWGLYLARADFVIRRKLVEDTAQLVDRLRQRSDLDITNVQLVRAEAAFAARKVSLVRTELAIRNAEDRIRALVNDDALRRSSNLELLPASNLFLAESPVDAGAAAASAVKRRREISEGLDQLRATAIREDVAKNELLPQLNLLFEGSLRGLAEDYRPGSALVSETEQASFMVGFSFEYPIGNNEAKARLLRRQLEVRQQLRQMRTAVETVLLEVKIAVREMATAYREMQGKYQSLLAAQEDLRTLEERWSLGEAGGQAGAAYLDLLIDSQGRVSAAEEDLMHSAVAYNVALMTVQRVQGTLLDYLEVRAERSQGPGQLPEFFLRRDGTSGAESPDSPVAPGK